MLPKGRTPLEIVKRKDQTLFGLGKLKSSTIHVNLVNADMMKVYRESLAESSPPSNRRLYAKD